MTVFIAMEFMKVAQWKTQDRRSWMWRRMSIKRFF